MTGHQNSNVVETYHPKLIRNAGQMIPTPIQTLNRLTSMATPKI